MQLSLVPQSFTCKQFKNEGQFEVVVVTLCPTKVTEIEQSTLIRWSCSFGQRCLNWMCHHAYGLQVEKEKGDGGKA